MSADPRQSVAEAPPVSVAKLDVVLCWHMHQPQYFEPLSGEYRLPWTYLHAIKDYADMAAHLEAIPQARAVVNFAPVLLEQIADYATHLAQRNESDFRCADPVLALLVTEAVPKAPEKRLEIIRWCLRAHAPRMIEPFPYFRELARIARLAQEDTPVVKQLAADFFLDLATCYHLAWCGATVRRQYPELGEWLAESGPYDGGMRRRLLEIIHEVLASIIPRYRALAASGQIELSFSPYAHPIMPLLLDLGVTREAMPDAALPENAAYPAGKQRVEWHLQKGREVFRRFFGCEPRGCWPSEGAVSNETLRLLDSVGLSWTATGQTVLANSLHHVPDREAASDGEDWLHRPYRLEHSGLRIFFRDDGLSDAIGFRYADWHADDAVGDFIHHLENIARSSPPNSVVSVILDGENAWEYYPENGYHFLSALYRRLAAHPAIRLRTFTEVCDDPAHSEVTALPGIVAGSWVYGTFSTWIGDPDKNAGWDRLIEARTAVDAVLQNRENALSLVDQLAVCEGSDWCWWFGGYNPAGSVSDFEWLYRRQLASLYQMAGLEVPEMLSKVLSQGGGDPAAGGTMRQGKPS